MISESATSFYTTGGTLPQDAPSYVERRADADLFEGLMAGDFCYVLNSRQMGKSSLMVRAAARLREAGVTVAILDLTSVGQNLTVEQWYASLLDLLGEQINLEEELDAYWTRHLDRSPLLRWMGALREVVLGRIPGRIVLFLDEIDVVRGLPFSADEFFAGVRELYTRRAVDPDLRRLAFCLLGVAAPSDLIRDPRLTPFNIGRRVELVDFTEAEAAGLAVGLASPNAGALVSRVLHWTGGHPYLTQRLCRAVAEEGTADARGVDRLCRELFLSTKARERDDNLVFVRERLLKGEGDPASVLHLYEQVWRGKTVPDDETDPLASVLRLSGVTRAEAGRLRVRNRIYERAFDRRWVERNLSDAELRRQRAAFRRGLVRTAAAASVIVAVIAGLAASERMQSVRADRIARQEADQRRRVEGLLYASDVNLANQAWQKGQIRRAMELLDEHRPRRGEADPRGFEWRYLWPRCRDQSIQTFQGQAFWMAALALSPDGRILATANGAAWDSVGRGVDLWDIAARRKIGVLRGHRASVHALAFSPDGRTLATGGFDGSAKLWSVANWREIVTVASGGGDVRCVAFSRDGRTLVTGGADGAVRLCDARSGRGVRVLRGHSAGVSAVAVAPDGRLLASASDDRTVRLWDLASGRGVATLRGFGNEIHSVAFSPDGRLLATAGGNNDDPSPTDELILWDVASRRSIARLRGHAGGVNAATFSHDGRLLASAGDDWTIRLWKVGSWQPAGVLRGHANRVRFAVFSPKDDFLATGSYDTTAKLWRVATRSRPEVLGGFDDTLMAVAISPDSKIVATGGDDANPAIRLWDAETLRPIAVLRGHRQFSIASLAFSPKGGLLASAGGDGTVRLWDIVGCRQVASFAAFGDASRLAFSPDGRYLASSGHGRTDSETSADMRVWDVASRREIPWPGTARVKAWGVAFSPDGGILATGDEHGDVKLWDFAAKREIATLKGHVGMYGPDRITSLAFAPDGRTLAAASARDVSVWRWDLATRRELPVLPGHAFEIFGIAFSPDGRTLAACGPETGITLWNAASGREAATLIGHRSYVWDAAFSPDGRFLASVAQDRTLRLWRAASFAETDAGSGAGAR